MYVEPAGQMTVKTKNDTAVAAMAFTEPPRTPPEVRMFRRSAKLEPGTRFHNHKQVEDSASLRLVDRKFGATSDTSADTTSGLISGVRPSILQKIKDEQAEKLYKNAAREPLGRSYDRGTVMPSKFKEGAPFGAAPTQGEGTSKQLIFPNRNVPPESEDIYIRSHGNYPPGAQKMRNYKWDYDPDRTVFGKKGDSIALNGVSKSVQDVLQGTLEDRGNLVNSKTVEDLRGLGDLLGKPRNLGHKNDLPDDFVFGCQSGKNEWSAGQTIRGEYPMGDDPELGKSITPGFRNVTVEVCAVTDVNILSLGSLFIFLFLTRLAPSAALASGRTSPCPREGGRAPTRRTMAMTPPPKSSFHPLLSRT